MTVLSSKFSSDDSIRLKKPVGVVSLTEFYRRQSVKLSAVLMIWKPCETKSAWLPSMTDFSKFNVLFVALIVVSKA